MNDVFYTDAQLDHKLLIYMYLRGTSRNEKGPEGPLITRISQLNAAV